MYLFDWGKLSLPDRGPIEPFMTVSLVGSSVTPVQLEVMDPDVVWRALNDYKNSNTDFPDHLMARINEAKGCEMTLTFDKKASRQPAFQLLK